MKDDKRSRLYERYMRMFAPMYDFSLCKEEEIGDVIEFIDTYWKKGHALVKSKALMDWQHYDPVTKTYNFAIARSKETGEIHALEGFIPTSLFDPGIRTPMTWGAIWKTREDVAPAGLGVVVKLFREHERPSAYAMEVGISPDAARYNEKLGNDIFALEPWYMANPEMSDYRLFQPAEEGEKAPAGSVESRPEDPDPQIRARRVTGEEWETLEGSFAPGAMPPYKSHAYYYNRYLAHPLYRYGALLLEDASGEAPGEAGEASRALAGAGDPAGNSSGKAREVIFYRVVSAEGRRGIFLVDYIGDGTLLSRAQKALTDLLVREDAEYILFLCSGLPAEALRKAGFQDRREDTAITPVYYEPFLRRNVDINCTSHGDRLPWPVFKGDADQDRPNVLS